MTNMTKENKRPIQLSVLPKEHEYLKGLITDAVWLITSKIEDEETLQPNIVIPREITITISLMPHADILPVLVSDSVRFGEAYSEQIESECVGAPASMGLPSWYSTDPREYWEKESTVDYFRTSEMPI